MKGEIKNYFPGANTEKGFFSYFSYLPYKMNKVYILKGGPGTGKSTFMKKIGEEVVNMGFDIEQHLCASDEESLDGLVIPKLKTALLDGTAPHMIDPEYPGARGEIINLGRYWNRGYLRNRYTKIKKYTTEIKDIFRDVYHNLKMAAIFKGEIKSHYQNFSIPEAAEAKTEEIIADIIDEQKDATGNKRHLFATGITPGGIINFLDNLTGDRKKRYLLEGKPGSGKGELIKKVAEKGVKQGFDITLFHCSLNPEQVEALIISDLDTAVINNTPPHAVEKRNEGDYTVNMMDTLREDISSQNFPEVEENKELYDRYLSRAVKLMTEEKKIHDRLEKIYVEAMNFYRVDRRRKKLMYKIL